LEGEFDMEELKMIMEKFAGSGWDLIANPAREWLDGKEDTKALILAIEQADKECGSCGCELDTLYKRALELL
jgi:hypothetical protein